MSIRFGVFRVGETVEVSAVFINENAQAATNIGGAKIFIKKPPPSNQIVEFNINPINGIYSMNIKPEVIGIWKVRIECELPSPTTREGKFEVVDSMVTPVLPYSFY